MNRSKLVKILYAIGSFFIAAALVIAVTRPADARPRIDRTVVGYVSTGPIRATNSDKCLELVSPHPDQKIDWAPCSPVGSNALQVWHAQVIHGSMIIYAAVRENNTTVLHICIDGGPHAGEYVYSYDCTFHVNPTSGLLLYGHTVDGAQNSIRSSLTGLWVTFNGGIGPATWDKGRNFIQRLFAGPKATQRVQFVSGWVQVKPGSE